MDRIRAHEVAHQWLGSYVRVKQWPRDRWLFEGLADYLAMEWYRTKPNVSTKPLEAMRKDWYEPLTFGSMERRNLAGRKEETEGQTAYPLLAATNNVYSKGPMVFHMLRYFITVKTGDDEAFFDMLRDFLTSYRYQPAGTDDFRKIAEKHAQESLDWFFHQWVEDGGIPVLFWTQEIARGETGWTVTLKARQDQKSYRLHVPVYLHYADGSTETRPWVIAGGTATATLEVTKKPTAVTLSDNLEVLAVLHAR